MALYHKRDVLQFFSLISDGLGGVLMPYELTRFFNQRVAFIWLFSSRSLIRNWLAKANLNKKHNLEACTISAKKSTLRSKFTIVQVFLNATIVKHYLL